MTGNFLDSNRQEHGVMGYEVSATQHMIPFVSGWFIRAYSNTYAIDESRMSIRHYYGVKDRARWTNVYRHKFDNYYTVEVYDSVQVDKTFFYHTVYKTTARNLKDAVHLANIHKSDK